MLDQGYLCGNSGPFALLLFFVLLADGQADEKACREKRCRPIGEDWE